MVGKSTAQKRKAKAIRYLKAAQYTEPTNKNDYLCQLAMRRFRKEAYKGVIR